MAAMSYNPISNWDLYEAIFHKTPISEKNTTEIKLTDKNIRSKFLTPGAHNNNIMVLIRLNSIETKGKRISDLLRSAQWNS